MNNKTESEATKTGLSHSATALLGDLKKAQKQRVAAIRADVFNPNESDMEYFKRRLAHHQAIKN